MYISMESDIKQKNILDKLPEEISKVFKQHGSEQLCFNQNAVLKDDFHVDKFISDCKKRVSLQSLREDLEKHYKNIRVALIEIINHDYADFVSLSSNLVGVEKILENLSIPLGQLKEEILMIKKDVHGVLSNIELRLRERRLVRERKIRLQHLLNVMSSLEKIEKILGADPKSHKMEMFLEAGRNTPGNFLERIAGEFNQLQFHVNQSKGHPIVEQIRPRVALITSKLQESLEISFQQGLRDKDEDLVLRCLRTYALIDKITNAEELFRHIFVAPYMATMINEDVYEGIGLMNICGKVFQFVLVDCKLLLDLTSETTIQESSAEQRQHRVKGFDFLVNAVWPEICDGFELRLPFIFSPGNPDVFIERYKVMVAFLEKFEHLCSSYESFERLRSHASYQSFLTRWSLPIYFQIRILVLCLHAYRLQEVGGVLEEEMLKPFIKVENETWKTSLFCSCWEAARKCFDDKIYVDPLAGRFWKTFLQVISRGTKQGHDVIKSLSEAPQISSNNGVHEDEKDSRIKNLTLLYCDTGLFIYKIKELFNSGIEPKLKKLGVTETKDYADGLQEAIDGILELRNSMQLAMVAILSEEAAQVLENVKNVPRLYRRTNREPPSQCLPYVSEAFLGLHAFKNDTVAEADYVKFKEILQNVVLTISTKYYNSVNELVTSIRKTEESLLRLKRQRKGGQSVGNTGNETTDENKIRTQLYLDCMEFGNQMMKMEVDLPQVNTYSQLKDLLEAEVKREPSA